MKFYIIHSGKEEQQYELAWVLASKKSVLVIDDEFLDINKDEINYAKAHLFEIFIEKVTKKLDNIVLIRHTSMSDLKHYVNFAEDEGYEVVNLYLEK